MQNCFSELIEAYKKVSLFESFDNLNPKAKDNILAKKQYEAFCKGGIELLPNGEIYLKNELIDEIFSKEFNKFFQSKYGASRGYNLSETKPITFRVDCRSGDPDGLPRQDFHLVENIVRLNIERNFDKILKYDYFYDINDYEFFISFTMYNPAAIKYVKTFLLNQAQMTLF